jgi:hypothetical protein
MSTWPCGNEIRELIGDSQDSFPVLRRRLFRLEAAGFALDRPILAD